MIPLLNAETQRYLSRRVTLFFPLTLALLIVVGVTIAYFVITSQDDSVDFVNDIAFGPSVADQPGASNVLGPLGFLLPIMAYTLGASFYGADQKTGVIELLATWEPRRLRLLAARAIGGSVVSIVLGMLVSAVSVAAFYVLSATTGTTDGMTGERWWWITMAVFRTGLLCAAFFLFGLALTVLANNSVASIISFVIYAFVVENILQIFVGWLAPWLPMANAGAFSAGVDMQTVTLDTLEEPTSHHGWFVAGLVVLAYPVVAYIAAAAVFDRRDIT